MKHLGNAAHLLGVRPWEWGLLSVQDADALMNWLEDYEAQQDKAEAEMKRR